MIQKVKRQTVTDSVIRQLIDLVASGAWPLGGRLPGELELAKQLGVGRTSVREALKALQVLGVLTRGNEGTFVAHTLPIEMLDDLLRVRLTAVGIDAAYLYQARRLLEGEIAWLAAQLRTADDIRELEAIWRRLKSLPAESVDEYLDLDMAFHRRLCGVVGNPILTKMWIIVFDALIDRRQQIRRARQSRIASRDRSGVGYPSIHEPLLQALRSGDADGARSVIHSVLREMEASVINSALTTSAISEPDAGEVAVEAHTPALSASAGGSRKTRRNP